MTAPWTLGPPDAGEDPSPGSIEAQMQGCICRAPVAGPTDIDPPEVKIDRNCSLHGIDPDRAREDRDDQAGECD